MYSPSLRQLAASTAFMLVSVGSTALAQTESPKITELPASASKSSASKEFLSSDTPSVSGLTIRSTKKTVSIETEQQYLKDHPEAAFILPADTQERIKKGLPVQNITISPKTLLPEAK